jgi:hypothetical protein
VEYAYDGYDVLVLWDEGRREWSLEKEILLRVTTPRHLNSAAMQVHAQSTQLLLSKLLGLFGALFDLNTGQTCRVNDFSRIKVTTISANW